MKRLLFACTLVGLIALISQRSVAKNNDAVAEPKHYQTTLADSNSRLSAEANAIDKDWATSTTHFKGNVSMYIWPGGKGYGYATVLHADQVDLNEKTGELLPNGNVRVTLEPRK